MKLNVIPELSFDMINDMEDMNFFTYSQIFDDLLIISQKATNCFVWKTEDGLVIFDAIWPNKIVYDTIIQAVQSVGWNPNNITKLVLTHGHVDHTGCGKWFVEKHNVKTYLSKTDDIFWQNNPTKPDRPDTWKYFDIDCYLQDGDIIPCKDKNIYVYSTPGHTPGCLSYIFPIVENGVTHMAALLGGATPPWGNSTGIEQFLDSLDYFRNKAKEKHVDVALCNHTAFDNGLERIAYSSKRLSYMPNIYIIGENGFERYCDMFKTLGLSAQKSLKHE